jgi:adenosylhomocysteine nucleosidase
VITGFVIALPEEISTLTTQKIVKGCCTFITDDKIIANAGAGPDNAKLAAEQLIAHGAQQLISWGCAAALKPELKPGDLVLATQLIDADLAVIKIDANWINFNQQKLQQHLIIQSGEIAESKTLVTSSTEKKQLQVKTGAIAVDMESIAVAKVAEQHQLPFLAIRAIADPANMDLPKAISAALNNQGDIELGKLLQFLAMHPSELPGLIKLGLHFHAAQKTLKLIAKYLDDITSYSTPRINS